MQGGKDLKINTFIRSNDRFGFNERLIDYGGQTVVAGNDK